MSTVAAATCVSPATAAAALHAGAVPALRAALADDASAPAHAAAALAALIPLVTAAAAAGTSNSGGPVVPAVMLVEQGLVSATAAALDPARPGTAAAKAGDLAGYGQLDTGGTNGGRQSGAAVAQRAAQLLHLPFSHPLPPVGTPAAAAAEASLQRYQETLLSEAIVVSLVQALDGLTAEQLVAPMGLLSQLVLRSPAYAQQFLEAGGLDEALTRRLLAPDNPPPVLVDALLAVSQLARISARHYSAIARANLCDPIGRLLSHEDPGVRARSCNLLGNMCRHSGYFYEAFVTHGTLDALIERCADTDRTTRKFACFAIGNAGFHSDVLYRQLRSAIPPLVALLADEEDKTRANAAAALGNLVRNSAALCGDLVNAKALEALMELATSPTAVAEADGGASPRARIRA